MGATRNFEGTKEGQKFAEEMKKKREQEEQGNAMKKLENRTMDNKMEMDILDGLDEIRELNARNSKLDPVEVLDNIYSGKDKSDDDDEDLVLDEDERQLLEEIQKGPFLRRLADDDDNDNDPKEMPTTNISNKDKKEDTVEMKPPPPRLPKHGKKGNKTSGVISIQTSTKKGSPPIILKFKPQTRDKAVTRTEATEQHTATEPAPVKEEKAGAGEAEVVLSGGLAGLVMYDDDE